MKKFYYFVGAVVTATAIFAFIAIMLKKLRISLSIEGVEDVVDEDEDNDEISLVIENDDTDDGDELIKEEIESMLEDDEI